MGETPVEETATSKGFWLARPRPVIVAHRFGNSSDRAREAIDAGADLLEADVWLHRGRLEARHAKTAGPLPIIWDRWWLARKPKQPFLAADLLDRAPPSTAIMFDLKGQNTRLPRALLELIRQEQGSRHFLVCGQNWAMLEQFRGQPGVEIVHSIGNERQLAAAWQKLKSGGYDAISIHNELLDAPTVARLKTVVAAVITWSINTDEQLERVLGFGVDGFTTDNLDLMRHVALSRPMSGSPAPD